jgi:hypothetical protein
MAYGRPLCAAWPRLDAAKTSSPAISGHRDYREIRTYVQAANKARMATDGMARTLAMFPAAKAESST